MSIRTARVAEEIQKVLGERIVRGLRDPLPGFVTIRGVEVTSDFTHAKVFVSVFGSADQKEGAIAGLIAQRGFLRAEVGKKIRLRNTPQLSFILDESAERAARVHALLDEVKAHERALAAQPAPPPPALAPPFPSPSPSPSPPAPALARAPEVKAAPTPTPTPAPVAASAAPAAKKAPATTKKAPATTKKAPATTKKASATTKKASTTKKSPKKISL